MRRIARRLWNFLSALGDKRPYSSSARGKAPVRLELWSLEERVLPSASTLGTVSGMVFVGAGAQQTPAPGVPVTLTGTSNQGDAISLTVTTDSQGDFTIRSVEAGTYQLAAVTGSVFVQGVGASEVTVVAGHNTPDNVSVGGFAADVISGRVLLSSATAADLPFLPAGTTANSAPFVTTPIANVTVASGSSTTVDLAANFSDPDITDSQVVFDTSDGPMTVNLNDAQAPQTVANFLDYVENSRYDGTIFHRLDTSPPVLQGGGFGLQTNSSGDVTSFPAVANANDPLLADEASSSSQDTLGTLAMAQPGNNANGATSQFFFNLANNTSSLAGNFAVFGQVASDPTSQAVFQMLQSTPVQDESAFNSAFGTLPISSSANLTNFPTNTTPSNYLTINNVQLVQQNESLTYSAVSSDTSLVGVSFVAGHPEVLSIQPVGPSGTATITVQATDEFGLSVQTSFQVTVAGLTIGSVTNPINAVNSANTTASGTADPGDSISVTATDGTNTSAAATTTAGTNGAWSVSGINVSTFNDGTITYTATTTDAAGATVTATKTSTKDTSAPTVAITSTPNTVNAATEASVTVTGTTTPGASVSVTASDGATPPVTVTVPATVDGSGNWTASINVSSLADGTITFAAVATNAAGNTAATHTTATKDTVPPAVAVITVTDPINSGNQTTTSATGTTEIGATVMVTASDGKTTTTPVAATVNGSGNWTAAPIDVSSLTDGTITYTATATDAAGNTNTATLTATKSTGP